MTMELTLTQGKIGLVDDEDFEWANQWKWYAHRSGNTFYATRKGPHPHRETIPLHREIMAAPKGMAVDHINGDGLDNRRSNLRIATVTENFRNRGLNSNNTSGFKGVSWHKATKKWITTIKVDYRLLHLGLFVDLEEAARAYDKAALEYFGEFARLNFPNP